MKCSWLNGSRFKFNVLEILDHLEQLYKIFCNIYTFIIIKLNYQINEKIIEFKYFDKNEY